jgi:hypothetical protein
VVSEADAVVGAVSHSPVSPRAGRSDPRSSAPARPAPDVAQGPAAAGETLPAAHSRAVSRSERIGILVRAARDGALAAPRRRREGGMPGAKASPAKEPVPGRRFQRRSGLPVRLGAAPPPPETHPDAEKAATDPWRAS